MEFLLLFFLDLMVFNMFFNMDVVFKKVLVCKSLVVVVDVVYFKLKCMYVFFIDLD